MKSVPNWTFYLHKISWIFIPFLSIFLVLEPVLVFRLNSFPLTCGARTSVAMSATASIPLATRGGACHNDRLGYKSFGVLTASIRSRQHPTIHVFLPLPIGKKLR
jgi:hypothetical protein